VDLLYADAGFVVHLSNNKLWQMDMSPTTKHNTRWHGRTHVPHTHLHELQLVIGRRDVQRRALVIIRRIHIRPRRNQPPQQLRLVVCNSITQGIGKLRSAELQPCARFDQISQQLILPCFDCLQQRASPHAVAHVGVGASIQ
jgi:hypothetical protein